MTRKRRLAVVFTIVILLIACAWFAYVWIFTLCCNAPGIDVSHHQGKIDWQAVSRSGVAFTYIKASEGGDFVDPAFATNWAAARAAGIATGAYHYFTPCRTGADQAKNFISTVPRTPGMLPPAVDAEHMEPCASSPGLDMARELAAFIDRIASHYGCRPVIYTTYEFERGVLHGRFTDAAFWIRSLLAPPLTRLRTWRFWQFHNDGRRSGISGPVDLNAFRGSQRDLLDFVAASGCAADR